ncbi:MAG: sigma 54-interacting transcriptional regulator [Planctomycetaceae bacterium]|nr:sigma 54-interacting transcriptional regulator [Planctomycetaceae bacterium]
MARARSRANALGRLLGASARAVYALDERRQIVYCNAACAALVGLTPEQLIGQRCDYQVVGTGTAPADVACSLCPPPEAWAGRLTASVVAVLHVSGELIPRQAELMWLGGDEVNGLGMVVALSSSAADPACADDAASEAAALHLRLAQLRRQYLADWPLDELVGVSLPIQRARDQVALAARGRTRVVIQGPAGSGREHIARLLHRRQSMPELVEPLVPLWCPLLDAELTQSTVADLVRQYGERASGGEPSAPPMPTLLLLEVDQLSPAAQAELAGFFDLPGFELHTIATSQESLLRLAAQDRFRADLAHVLSTLVIEVPPLAARPHDIPLLCQCLVERFNAKGGRQLSGFTAEALDELAVYQWPENVDELAEVVESACEAADGPFVEASQLPDKIRWALQAAAHPRREEPSIILEQFLEAIEKELIERALKRSKGNKTKAARLLGVSRARLHRRVEHFGLLT